MIASGITGNGPAIILQRGDDCDIDPACYVWLGGEPGLVGVEILLDEDAEILVRGKPLPKLGRFHETGLVAGAANARGQ